MRYFDRLHPACALVYFAAVIALCMLTLHPLVVLICFLSGVTFYGVLCGVRRLCRSFALSLPLILAMTLLNPLFSHKGSTPLLFINDKPITLEACAYGAVSALAVAGVLYWFLCYSEIMTSDKVIYLFGRVSPRLSLLLCMTLAAVPRLRRQYAEIVEAQRVYGNEAGAGLMVRLHALSALVTYALEGSIGTADSMRARGYGLKGRSSYSIFRFGVSDAVMLTLTAVLVSAIVALLALGGGDFTYYPLLVLPEPSSASRALCAACAALTGLPILIEIKEKIQWHISTSTI